MRSTTELRQHFVEKAAPMTARAFDCQPVAGRVERAHVAGMAEKDKEREERLAAALRENLRKRKAQARELDRPKADDQP
jgi:hypothetical protein